MLGPGQLDTRRRGVLAEETKGRPVAGLQDCWISGLLDARLHCWIALLDCIAG